MVVPVGVVGVVLGITSAMIVLPRPVAPLDMPLPSMVSASRIAQLVHADADALEQTRSRPLRLQVRALGTAFLEWNAAGRSGTPTTGPDRERVVLKLRTALGDARRSAADESTSDAELRLLRAVQTELFVRELQRWRREGSMSDELGQLAGTLPELLVRNGWIDGKGRPRVPEEVIRVRYKLHWTSVIWSLQDCERAPSPVCYGFTTLPIETDEMRIFMRYLLQHPVLSTNELAEASSRDTRSGPDPEALRVARIRRRLSYLERFVTLDEHQRAKGAPPLLAHYPVDLARATLLFRLGQYQGADAALRRVIAQSGPDERDSRAINWLLAVLARS